MGGVVKIGEDNIRGGIFVKNRSKMSTRVFYTHRRREGGGFFIEK